MLITDDVISKRIDKSKIVKKNSYQLKKSIEKNKIQENSWMELDFIKIKQNKSQQYGNKFSSFYKTNGKGNNISPRSENPKRSPYEFIPKNIREIVKKSIQGKYKGRIKSAISGNRIRSYNFFK